MPQKQEGGVLTSIDASELKPALEPAKRQMIRRVARKKASVFEAGAAFTKDSVTRRYRVHPDRTQYIHTCVTRIIAARGLPGSQSAVPFVAIDGTVVQMSATDIDGVAGVGGFANAYTDYVLAAETAAITHEATINALTDVDAVLAYDITTGWPA